MKAKLIPVILLLLCGRAPAQQQLTNSGNMQLHPGASMTIYGDFTNNGTFTDTGQVVSFKGSGLQTISGSTPVKLNNCSVDNPSGVKLQCMLSVKNTLVLSSGALRLNGNMLDVRNSSTTAISRTSGYIESERTDNSSKVRWSIGSTTGAHTYPFGFSGDYIPFVLNLTAGNIGNVTVSTYGTGTDNLPLPVTPQQVTNIETAGSNDNSPNTVDRFWQIDKDGSSGTATITFTARSAESGAIANLQAQRWNSSTQAWDPPLPGQTGNATSVTVTGVTSFSPWTLAGNDAPLPVELISFTAKLNGDQVDLGWITASERNNDYFTVEKTADGQQFVEVLTQDGAGNSNELLQYAGVDPDPYGGISYYRLKQTDFDGTFKYSDLVPVQVQGDETFSMNIYPNPAPGEFYVSVFSGNNEDLTVTITDVGGKVHYSGMMSKQKGNFTTPLNSDHRLAAGLYTVTVSAGEKMVHGRLVIR